MIRSLLFIAYALFAHLSVLFSAPALEWVSLTALTGMILYPRLRTGASGAWLGLAASILACGALTQFDGARYVTFLPSIALPGVTLYSFADSLLPGRIALVTRMAAALHDPLPPMLVAYTRKVTWLWTLVIATVLLLDIYLIGASSRKLWSEFANIDIYGILAAVFLGEYAYRRIRFRALRQPGFLDYLRLLSKQRPGLA